MNAIQILREWVNNGNTQGMTLTKLKLHYYDKLVKEPINVAQIDRFSSMLYSDNAKKIYQNVLEKSDERYICHEPLRINRIFPLFDEHLNDNVCLMANMFSLFAEYNLINYGCLTKMSMLPIIPMKKGGEQYVLCYCYLYSDYSSDELNELCGSELFCPDYQPLSTLNHDLPNHEVASANIVKWFEIHQKHESIVLRTTNKV